MSIRSIDSSAFGLGTIYSQQGIEDDPWTLKTDYITLPLTAFYYPVRGLGIYVGVEPAFLVRKKAEIMYGQHSQVAELPNVGDVTKRYIDEYGLTYEGIFDKSLGAKRGVVSLPIGVNYEFDHCVFGVKYSIGLGNAISGPGVSCTHNVFQISLGYRFNVFGDVKKVEYKREKKDEKKGDKSKVKCTTISKKNSRWQYCYREFFLFVIKPFYSLALNEP